MALLKIRTYPDKVLLEKAAPVEKIDEEIKKLAGDMARTMYAAPGIGLAAPQVGRSVRMVVVDLASGDGGGQLYTLINPEITHSEGEITYEEGCLSLPDVNEEVTRPSKVTVCALDLEGKKITVEGEDLLAVCMQHEIDHLDGVLFIDHLGKLKRDLLRKKLKKDKAAAEAE